MALEQAPGRIARGSGAAATMRWRQGLVFRHYGRAGFGCAELMAAEAEDA